MSTLPCVKLRAIVEAAREISRLYEREHGDGQILGADDFLPIFIYSVARAEMERPCALCELIVVRRSNLDSILWLTFRCSTGVLLQTLCDWSNRTGEIGYFQASFEAAVSHIQELDLTEDKEDCLTDVSLND